LAEIPGVQAKVLTLRDAFTEADMPEWHPIMVRAFPTIGPPQFGFSPKLARALLETDADVAHVHGLWMYPSVCALKWQCWTRRPGIISPRGMLDAWALNNSWWKKRVAGWLFENRHLRQAACLHAVCDAEAQAIRAYGLKNPIAIIPNGVDLPDVRTANAERQMSNWQPVIEGGRKILLYLGRLHPKKGLVNLLRAWARVSPERGVRHGEWALAIAGWDQGGHEVELKQIATELAIRWADIRAIRSEVGNQKSEIESASVLFLGPQFGPDKDVCFRACDAFVLPSFSEGLPVAVLEAWAYGKPVLMTPQCNLPEGFATGAAVRIEPNPESIARGLEELFRTPGPALRALGANGRSLVASRFAWSQIARDMKSVYEWVLGGGPRPNCAV
jgi:poly(glycerol-phosphate) alpha-glucosyltransferase